MSSNRPPRAFRWSDIRAPVVTLHDPDADGLELQVEARTEPESWYRGLHFATGRVTTIVRGEREDHEHVLLTTKEPVIIADFVGRVLREGRADRTVSVFDDGMTIRAKREHNDVWSVTCRPVPPPPPGATWKTFPEFTFTIGKSSLERAGQQLVELAKVLDRSKS